MSVAWNLKPKQDYKTHKWPLRTGVTYPFKALCLQVQDLISAATPQKKFPFLFKKKKKGKTPTPCICLDFVFSNTTFNQQLFSVAKVAICVILFHWVSFRKQNLSYWGALKLDLEKQICGGGGERGKKKARTAVVRHLGCVIPVQGPPAVLFLEFP